MIAVVQRVDGAGVSIGGTDAARIGPGLLILLGVEAGDAEESAQYLARKISGLRIFDDGKGSMNLSLLETGGEALVVSQFTLAARTEKGRRPSFDRAAAPGYARAMYERFAELLRNHGVPTQTGIFGGKMKVDLVNDGPATFVLKSPQKTNAAETSASTPT